MTFSNAAKIVLDDNIVMAIQSRNLENIIDGGGDQMAGYYFCLAGSCSGMTVTNNAAIGIEAGAFYTPSHACGEEDTQTIFRGNSAHSIGGVGHQQFVQPVPQEHLEVRRTFVPNKIYNYIPVGSSVTESHTENTHPPHNEEAYEVLLKEYEKLYDKFKK